MAFRFEIRNSPRRVSDERILDGIRALSKELGGRPVRRIEFDRWPNRPCTANSVDRRFGSWNSALAAAGLSPPRPRQHTPARLIEILEEVWRTLGRAPGRAQLQRLARISPGPFTTHWGSLRRACEALARFHDGHVTREQLLTPPGRRGALNLRRRWRIFARDGYRCVICGRTPATDPGVELQVDHIHPLSRGGTNDESNLRTLCSACNLGRREPHAHAPQPEGLDVSSRGSSESSSATPGAGPRGDPTPKGSTKDLSTARATSSPSGCNGQTPLPGVSLRSTPVY